MRKLFHSNFELDLSNFKISDTEENNWFSDSFFTKYSFPFEIDLTDDLDAASGFLSHYNASEPVTYYELKYIHNDEIQEAIFEIEQMQLKLSCTLRFGMEQLPSFDKKLSELSLDKITLASNTNIFAHAQSVITKTFPEVNYNFPQIHTDKYDVTQDHWTYFGGIINKAINGAVVYNEYNVSTEVGYYRNIIQPLPYWIHILQRGMIDSGYTLSGEILRDERLQKACLYAELNHEEDFDNEFLQTISINLSDYDSVSGGSQQDENDYELYRFVKKYTATRLGRHRVVGTLFLSDFGFDIPDKLKVYSDPWTRYTSDGFRDGEIHSFDIDCWFDVTYIGQEIQIFFTQRDKVFKERYLGALNIELISVNTVPVAYLKNTVDLTKSVPGITFGDFVKVVKNWFNYDLSVVDGLAIMNLVEDEINYENAVSLEEYEVKYPLRKFSQGTSFLLQFTPIENKKYPYLPVFQNRDQVLNSKYTVDEKTTVLEIEALPLPSLNKNGVETAYAVEDNDGKVFLVAYNGLTNGENITLPNTPYLLPEVHLKYWYKWFDFRINAQSFNWSFKIWGEQLSKIKAKTKVFAYNRYHIIKTINRTETVPDLYDVDIDTVSSK